MVLQEPLTKEPRLRKVRKMESKKLAVSQLKCHRINLSQFFDERDSSRGSCSMSQSLTCEHR